MNTTNKHNLPKSFVRYNDARNAAYSRGDADISVTQLIDAAGVRLLRDKHTGELVDDVVDAIWPLLGTAVHEILQEHADEEDVVEERLSIEVNDWVLSGAIDNQKIDGNTVEITDYKVTSVWSVMLGEKIEWIRQQNVYAALVEQVKGMEVTSIRICAVLRDWSRREATYKKDYPQTPIIIIDLPLWSPERRMEYIRERVEAHQNAQMAFDADGTVEPCIDSDKWAKPTSYAVIKKGNKRAAKVMSNFEAAKTHMSMLNRQGKGVFEVHTRHGENTRCEGNYCRVAGKCEFQMDVVAERVLNEITKDVK
jgi:hypothetical protein